MMPKGLPDCHVEGIGLVRDHLKTIICERGRVKEMEIKREKSTIYDGYGEET